MRGLSSKIYDKEFFLHACLGSEEFKKSKGKKLHPNVLKLLSYLPDIKDKTILDIGCGRGDISLYLAKKAKKVVGIDYSKDAIELANEAKLSYPATIQKKLSFLVMNAKKLKFPDNYFDIIINIDVFEHLYHEELTDSINQMSRVLKKDGILFVHTCTNKLLCDVTYKWYVLPMNKFITAVDKFLKHTSYDSLPDDPRTEYEKQQHINEPTYYYLKKLFKDHKYVGKMHIDIGCLKEGTSWRTKLYNFVVALYPISKLYPLNIYFGWAFICIMHNKKPN